MNFGGRCDCSEAPGWTDEQTWTKYCSYGQCFSSQKYEWCVGKDEYHPVGDGTWCENDERHTNCTIVREQGRNDFYLIKHKVH